MKTLLNTVYDWTFTYTVNKIDEDEKPLAGAVFNVKEGDTAIGFTKLADKTDKDYYVVGGTVIDIETTGKEFVSYRIRRCYNIYTYRKICTNRIQ